MEAPPAESSRTTAGLSSLNARLNDANGAIAAAQGALASLTRQIDFTQASLTINASAVPVAHGFTLGKAARGPA